MGISVNKWSDVKCSDVEWTEVIYVKWFCFELKWSEVKWITVTFLGTKVPCTLQEPFTEGTWLPCDYFICLYLVLLLFCFVMCGWVYVGVFWQLCGCFGDVDLYLLCCVLFVLCFLLFLLCIFILICFISTRVRTKVTEWKISCSK